MRVIQSTAYVTDILEYAMAGHLVPAAFQRDYAWSPLDVEALWKSVAEGWPIGSFLLWQPPADMDKTAIANNRLGPVPMSEHWSRLILDGQNRLATLAWSLHAPGDLHADYVGMGEQEAETWNERMSLVCDWDERRIMFVPEEYASTGYRMPVACLADTRPFNRAARAMYRTGLEDDAPIAWMDGLSRRLRDAKASMTVLEDATPAQAVEAFAHIARVGQPVNAHDVQKALSWVPPEARNQPRP